MNRLALATCALALLLAGCGPAARPTPPRPSAPPAPTATAPATPASLVASRFDPLSFTAVSVTHWWVLGIVACGTRDCLSIETTTDDGRTFSTLKAPGGSFAPGLVPRPPAASIRFADPLDGWVYGPGLWATHDGGLSWRAVPVTGTVSDLEAGLGQVYAVIQPPTPACSQSGTCGAGTPAPMLWRTQPSADDWSADLAAGPVDGPLAVHGESVWADDAMATRDGFAFGTGLMHSADGGASFALAAAQVHGIWCTYSPVSDSFVWAYCSGGHFMFAFISSDAGTSLTEVGTASSGPSPDGLANGATLAGASPLVAVAAGSLPGSAIIRTADGGARWQKVHGPLDPNGNWSLIGFTTDEVGYAFWQDAGTGQLWRTVDGGITWARVTALP